MNSEALITPGQLYELARRTKTRGQRWDRLGDWCVRTETEDSEIRVYRDESGHHEILAFNRHGCWWQCGCHQSELLTNLLEGIFNDVVEDRVYTGRIIEKWISDFETACAVLWTQVAHGAETEAN